MCPADAADPADALDETQRARAAACKVAQEVLKGTNARADDIAGLAEYILNGHRIAVTGDEPMTSGSTGDSESIPSCGEFARQRRAALDLTRDEVAARAEVSLSTMVRLELEDHVPGGRALVRIARVLGVTAEDLLPMDRPSPGDLLGTAEVCALLGGLDKSTIVRWVQAGKLTPAHKMPGASGAYLFRRRDVEALASTQPEGDGAVVL